MHRRVMGRQQYIGAFRHSALAVVVMLFAGCAQLLPVRAKMLAPGIYRLEVSGNAFASVGSLRQKIHGKANRLCGDAGYTNVETPDHEFFQQQTYYDGMTYSAGYQVLTQYIRCSTP